MSVNYSFARNERAYVQTQPVFGVINNTSGTATVGNSNAMRFIRMELQNEVALLERPDKTGTRSAEGMIKGRALGRWSLEQSLVANGTPGTLPDSDPIFQSIFGQTATVSVGSQTITSSTNASPIVVTCSGASGIASASVGIVAIAGHLTNTAANGVWLCYSNSANVLTLIGSTGNGIGSGGTVSLVNIAYSFVDNISQFTLWSFRTPSTLDQRVGNTCLVAEASFSMNQDVATWSANGDAYWVLRSSDFTNYDQYQLGGLTSFPVEPSAPVTNGSIIPGFTGRFVAGQSANTTSNAAFATNAYTFTTIRNVSIRAQTQNLLVRDTFGSYYATLTEGDVRHVTLSFNVYDDDGPEVAFLKSWGDSKIPVDFVLNVGTVVGSTFVFYLKNVFLASHVLGDGQLRFDAAFADSRATTSNLRVRDEFQMYIV